ncbi:protein of unknown function [Actinacidiphila alni]|uniref:DUF4184 family protein n=1 Tax=Actinacidiphila alni TaxID=380248 RepID=A0A1I2H4X7_9ACTN|nr:DUF4184 family protein [Actinacidiphila alni]SFF24047.1 protein of unknown function [Actinacidiphila alni]
MPLTFSHPAAVLPLFRDGRGRGRLIASALVAGSMAPDVPYFTDSLLPGTFGYGTFTHSLPGVVTADVALAAAMVAGWHWLLREPLVALLPRRWAGAADELTAPRSRPRLPAGAAWFVVSAVAGAATHVGWDDFTHPGRAGVRLLPVLNRTVGSEPLYHLLQYASSVAGLGVLAWYVPRALRRADRTPRTEQPRAVRRLRLSIRARTAALALIGAAAVAGAAQRLARWETADLRHARVLDTLPTVTFGAGTGAAVGLACYAACAHLARARGGGILRGDG